MSVFIFTPIPIQTPPTVLSFKPLQCAFLQNCTLDPFPIHPLKQLIIQITLFVERTVIGYVMCVNKIKIMS